MKYRVKVQIPIKKCSLFNVNKFVMDIRTV